MPSSILVRKDHTWKHAIPRTKKGAITCLHCKTKYNRVGINQLKYHLAQIPMHDAKPCTLAPIDVVREVQMQIEAFEEKKKLKRKQREEMSNIGGEASSIPPFPRSMSSGSGSESMSIRPQSRKDNAK